MFRVVQPLKKYIQLSPRQRVILYIVMVYVSYPLLLYRCSLFQVSSCSSEGTDVQGSRTDNQVKSIVSTTQDEVGPTDEQVNTTTSTTVRDDDDLVGGIINKSHLCLHVNSMYFRSTLPEEVYISVSHQKLAVNTQRLILQTV